MKLRSKMGGSKIYVHIALLLFSISFIFPFVWMFLTSFKSATEAITVPPRWFPETFLFQNYPELFDLYPFGAFFINSMLTAFFRVVCALAFSSIAGYAFARIKFPGRNVLFGILIIQFMVPYQIFILPQYKMVLKMGQLNTVFALVFPGLVSIFGTFLMVQAFKSMPKELSEAATIDGANQWTIFSRIYLPLAKSHMVALGILTVLGSWKDLMWPLIVNTDIEKMTLTSGILFLSSAKEYVQSYPLLMVGATIASIPLVIIYFIFQRFIIEGVASTGIK